LRSRLVLEAAIRIHHTEQAFQRGLLKNERPCETPNHGSYDDDGVHFLILLPEVEQLACRSLAPVLPPVSFARHKEFEEGIRG